MLAGGACMLLASSAAMLACIQAAGTAALRHARRRPWLKLSGLRVAALKHAPEQAQAGQRQVAYDQVAAHLQSAAGTPTPTPYQLQLNVAHVVGRRLHPNGCGGYRKLPAYC